MKHGRGFGKLGAVTFWAVGLVWLASLAALARPALAAPAGAGRAVVILALGDSLTAGLGLPEDRAFPAVLARRLTADGFRVQVINAGVSGDTTAGGLDRLSWLLAEKPQMAIVELGANDGLAGTDPALTEANLDAILTQLQKAGVKVLFTGMLAPPNLGFEFTDRFKAVFPRLAAKHKVEFYPFFLTGVAGKPELNLPDGLHPNGKGVVVIVDNIYPLVRRMVAELAGGSPEKE
ncbi:MAG: arylesterase [Deltaproteobacteria bacterium]|nr:arylesterase [Deltaproteobacteria bacterium]